jgi:ribosomal protein S27E
MSETSDSLGAKSLLALIPRATIDEGDLEGTGLNPASAIVELMTRSPFAGRHVQIAVLQVLLRALETYILADHDLLNLSRYRDLLLGQEDEHIRRRLKELFQIDPPTELVLYLRRCLTGRAACNVSGQKKQVTEFVERIVLDRAVNGHPRREVRCAICGYHFLIADVGSRIEYLNSLGAAFADLPDPGRLEDELKPPEYSRLELDHIVPEEGFGWSDADNLQVTCQFCNTGRLIFRRAFEPLSTMIAGALGLYPPSRPHRMTRQVIAVATLLESKGLCFRCGTPRVDAELTVELRNSEPASRLWFVPWNLNVTCYRCHS